MLNPGPTILTAMVVAALSILVPVSADAAQLALSWTDNAGDEQGFLIERRGAAGGSFAQVGVVGPNVVAFLDSGVAVGVAYCYRVRAFNGVGVSAYTNEACGTAAGAPTSPLAVTLAKSAYSRSETLVTTVSAVGGLVTTPIDAYVVLEVGGGGLMSLQTDGRLVPGLVPMARGIVLPTASLPFAFPLAGAPAGTYRWLAAVTTPGTLTLVSPLASTPFTITP